jgi:hypothetical protein
MQQPSSKVFFQHAGVVALVALCTRLNVSAGEIKPSSDAAELSKKITRMNCGAQIECMTPDGHAGQVSRLPAPDPAATALIMEDDTVTCLLQEGETNFVIELPQTNQLDRFTFLNENATARGELRISVSNHRLPVNSPEWMAVEGIIPFAHKRLFGVSLLGIEAKFVRLSFRVEEQGRVSVAPSKDERSRESNHGADRVAESRERFEASALHDALDSNFGKTHSRGGSPIFLSFISSSVAPLTP